jgi:hypothetical protein
MEKTEEVNEIMECRYGQHELCKSRGIPPTGVIDMKPYTPTCRCHCHTFG